MTMFLGIYVYRYLLTEGRFYLLVKIRYIQRSLEKGESKKKASFFAAPGTAVTIRRPNHRKVARFVACMFMEALESDTLQKRC